MAGPLDGVRVVEIVGLGPGPFCGMLLADLGAEVIRVDRVDRGRMLAVADTRTDVLGRGRRSVAVDLRHPAGVEAVLGLVEDADMLFEGMRPGVAERLGIGPEDCLEINPALVYGRMTGWGQEGPLAARAGHDIDYIALSGMLAAIGPRGGDPVPPLNLVGDFGGGGLLLAFGMVAAFVHARATGEGQVVDAAMVDGASLLGSMIHGLAAGGTWTTERGDNLLDGGAPFYAVYRTADDRHMAVGALEPAFYRVFLEGLDLPGPLVDQLVASQWDRATWETLRQRFTLAFARRTRDEWETIYADTDACVAPVLDLHEAPEHPHMVARGTFVTVGGVVQPAPAPRFSVTPTTVPTPPVTPGTHTDEILRSLNWRVEDIEGLRSEGAVY